MTLSFNKLKVATLILGVLLFADHHATAQTDTAKPWTYWWWMAGAVNEKDIKHSLEDFKRIGIGGVHIIPIYGAKGYEKEFKPFLGDEWMKMLQYTVAEAKKLNIGVDMSTGSGWPFGGPNISRQMSAQHWVYSNGKFSSETTGQKVKRPGPGGAGFVADPFDKNVMSKYLTRFDSAFAKYPAGVRAMYSDSYEVFGANWTQNFLSEFKKRRGYDLEQVANIFLDSTANLNATLVKLDYQQTLSELLQEDAETWGAWSRKHGFINRYQAHGSPGNILDLYASADIPETEAFGSSAFKIPLLRVEPDYEPQTFGRPNPLMMKFASSEAGVAGKRLISSETCTWLANHFKVSLSQVKPQVDELLTAGINHVFFHGTTFSPQADPYPGWLFYASTNFGASSHFYNEMPLLTKYISNCQSILQQSKPDNDVLVYFPLADIWADPKTATESVHRLDVHHSDNWFLAQPFGQLCDKLSKSGFCFDYISDRQLNNLKVENGLVKGLSCNYKVIAIPQCTYMPEATLERLMELGKQGATIIFDQRLPKGTMGYNGYKENSETFEKEKAVIGKSAGHVLVSKDIESTLVKRGAVREMLASAKLSFIRKKLNGKTVYFISNLNNAFNEGWMSVGKGAKFTLYDPLTGKKSSFITRKNKDGLLIYLSLLPGKSCFVMEDAAAKPAALPKTYQAYNIKSKWQVQFLGGRPDYRKTFNIDTLQSWTKLSDTASFYSGRAVYASNIKIPKEAIAKNDVMIDLGTVNESASLKINGKVVGTAWCIPYRLNIPANILKAGDNKVEVTVTNLSANYMRVYDQQHPEWRKFYDANIVDITYKPFKAANWAIMPSGLVTDNMKLLYR